MLGFNSLLLVAVFKNILKTLYDRDWEISCFCPNFLQFLCWSLLKFKPKSYCRNKVFMTCIKGQNSRQIMDVRCSEDFVSIIKTIFFYKSINIIINMIFTHLFVSLYFVCIVWFSIIGDRPFIASDKWTQKKCVHFWSL